MAPRLTIPTNEPGTRTEASTPSGQGRRGHTARRVTAALFWLLVAAGMCGAETPRASRAALRQAQKRGPTVAGELPVKVSIQLQSGFRSALHKLHWVSSCRNLFAQVGADGIEVLGSTTYTLAGAGWQDQVCQSSEAFTTVGGSKVWLCGSFGRISEKDAALILLHEALHNAGLGEQPRDPDGLTPDEIDHLVVKRCGF